MRIILGITILLSLAGCASQADIKLSNEARQERREARIAELEKTIDGSGGAVYLFAEAGVIYSIYGLKDFKYATPSAEAIQKSKYSVSGLYYDEAFVVKIPLELGERFCLGGIGDSKDGITSRFSGKTTSTEKKARYKSSELYKLNQQCDFSILATENKRRYIRVTDRTCDTCYGGTKHFNDAMIDKYFENRSKNPIDQILPTLLFLPFKDRKELARDQFSFLLPWLKNIGYIYDKEQFYALCDFGYETELETWAR